VIPQGHEDATVDLLQVQLTTFAAEVSRQSQTTDTLQPTGRASTTLRLLEVDALVEAMSLETSHLSQQQSTLDQFQQQWTQVAVDSSRTGVAFTLQQHAARPASITQSLSLDGVQVDRLTSGG